MNKLTIPEKLLTENRIKILGEYTAAQKHHDMECLVCAHVWRATPKSKTQTFKKYGVSGCPECYKNRRIGSNLEEKLKEVNGRGIEILTENFDGRYWAEGKYGEERNHVDVINNNCGHEFRVSVLNLFTRGVTCPVCNKQRKREFFQGENDRRSAIFQETASEWEIYRNEVYSKTRVIYNENKHIINPDDLPRGVAGEEGVYHLDHIKAVRFCFDNDIPIDECAHVDNLQMLSWEENLKYKDKIKP